LNIFTKQQQTFAETKRNYWCFHNDASE